MADLRPALDRIKERAGPAWLELAPGAWIDLSRVVSVNANRRLVRLVDGSRHQLTAVQLERAMRHLGII